MYIITDQLRYVPENASGNHLCQVFFLQILQTVKYSLCIRELLSYCYAGYDSCL